MLYYKITWQRRKCCSDICDVMCVRVYFKILCLPHAQILRTVTKISRLHFDSKIIRNSALVGVRFCFRDLSVRQLETWFRATYDALRTQTSAHANRNLFYNFQPDVGYNMRQTENDSLAWIQYINFKISCTKHTKTEW